MHRIIALACPVPEPHLSSQPSDKVCVHRDDLPIMKEILLSRQGQKNPQRTYQARILPMYALDVISLSHVKADSLNETL